MVESYTEGCMRTWELYYENEEELNILRGPDIALEREQKVILL